MSAKRIAADEKKKHVDKANLVEQRRAKVAALLLSGRKQREIAALIDVSVGTVNSDLKALVKEWQRSQASDIDAAKTIDVERIEAGIRAIWLNVTQGNLQSIDRLERLIRLKGDILGYGRQEDDRSLVLQPITVIEVVKDYGPNVLELEVNTDYSMPDPDADEEADTPW